MLVLSRKENEAIVIGEGENKIIVEVVWLDNQRVRLGITAPPDVPVHREEVYDKIHGEDK